MTKMRRARLAPGHVQLPPDPSRKKPVDPEIYERVSPIGSGSYGTVFKGQNQITGETYAIKTHKNINNYAGDQIRYRLMNELVMLSSNHLLRKSDCRYIIKLRDWYQKNGHYGLVMDFHDTDLHRLLSRSRDGLLDESTVKFLLAEILLAIEAVHSVGVIHNDIKPENILIDSDGHAILTDFGIAEFGPDKKYGRYGTPVYMAPESLKICGHDKQADWWAFGVMMYEMLTGFLPYDGKNSAELIKAQKRPLQFPSHVGDPAIDLISRLLTRNPLKRISNNVQNIKSHPFFSEIDWKSLEKGLIESPLHKPSARNFEPCKISTRTGSKKRREDASMFRKMKQFFSAKKRFVQSAPGSPVRNCKLNRSRNNRFSFRSLVPAFSTRLSTHSNPQKSGGNII